MKALTERMENCNSSHHPQGGHVGSKLSSFKKANWKNEKLQLLSSSSMRRSYTVKTTVLFSHTLIGKQIERMENCSGSSHHPWGGNVYSKLDSFSRMPTVIRRNWMNGKLQQKEVFIHEEAVYTFLIGPSLALIAENSPCRKKKVLGFSSGRGRF